MNLAGWALDLWHAASALRQAAFAVAEAGGAFFVCRACGGAGAWETEIAHRARQTDGGPVPCCVERVHGGDPSLYARLVTAIQDAEGRSGDSPVIGGEGRG